MISNHPHVRNATAVATFAILLIFVHGAAISADIASSGCSDKEFVEADNLFQKAIKEKQVNKKIDLYEKAFTVCPDHGQFAQGYYELAKLYMSQDAKNKAFKWLKQANRFRAIMLQRSIKDLADTNLLLANLYKENRDMEKSLVHMNVYRSLAQSKKADEDFVANIEDYYDVIYTPGTVKEALALDKDIAAEYRHKLMRLEVYFDFDKSELDANAMKRLDGIGEALQDVAFNGCVIIVEGHTDQLGKTKYNDKLGAHRASEVVNYLKSKWHINTATLKPISFGERKPSISRKDHPKEQWPKIDKLNRRVVIWNKGFYGRKLTQHRHISYIDPHKQNYN